MIPVDLKPGWCSWCDTTPTDYCVAGHPEETWFIAVHSDGRIQRWKDGTPVLHHSQAEASRYTEGGQVLKARLRIVSLHNAAKLPDPEPDVVIRGGLSL